MVHIQLNIPENMDRTIHWWLNIPENYQKLEDPEILRKIWHFQIAISADSMRWKSKFWQKSGYIEHRAKRFKNWPRATNVALEEPWKDTWEASGRSLRRLWKPSGGSLQAGFPHASKERWTRCILDGTSNRGSPKGQFKRFYTKIDIFCLFGPRFSVIQS